LLLPTCHYEKCDEQAHGRKYYSLSPENCIFHDKNFLKGDNYDINKNEVARKFLDKLSNYVSDRKALYFNGYNLPALEFVRYEFSERLKFSDATFYGLVNFFGATFTKGASFDGAAFTKGADFSNATLTNEANFSSATFAEGAYFFGAVFTERANFEYATFTEVASFSHAIFSKGAVFSRAIFSKGVDFSGATFTKEACATLRQEAYFYGATFTKEAYFYDVKFQNSDFSEAKFLNEVRFSGSEVFKDETLFRYTIFEQPTKTVFDVNDLSKVSFAGSDISKVTFTDKVKWGGNDCLKIIEEEWIETGRQNISLDLVLYVYRRLRENYEFNLKFDEAGKFFIKEMELKRKYRTIHRQDSTSSDLVGKNNWFRRHFSLTGLYYHFSSYGESIIKPTVIGIITVALSTLFWLMQSKPTLEPHFFVSSSLYHNTSHYVYLSQAGNPTQWLAAFQRSLGDFLPVLSLPSDIKVGVVDYITKIVGGALTFGLLIIAFRRKFERKYTR